jgi:hypothetical protein
MSEFGVSTHPRARRDYRCEWCGEKIFTGEIHFKFAGVWEGDFQNYRMHLECEKALNFESNYNEGFTPFDNERPTAPVLAVRWSESIPVDRTYTSCTQSGIPRSTA